MNFINLPENKKEALEGFSNSKGKEV